MAAKIPIRERKKMVKVGGSIMLPMPLEWFRAHGFGETAEEIMKNIKQRKFLIIANRDVRLVHPLDEQKVDARIYDVTSALVKEADVVKKEKEEAK